MADYQHTDLFVLRTPLLPIPAVQGSDKSPNLKLRFLRELNKLEPSQRSLFLDGLNIASPGFVLGLLPDLEDCSGEDRSVTVALKYLRRASTRTSPFGFFGVFSVGSIGEKTRLVHEQLELIAWRKPVPTAACAQIVMANPTLYRLGDEIRFSRQNLQAHGGQARYECVSVESDAMLDWSLAQIDVGVSRAAFIDLLQKDGQMSPSESLEYLEALLAEQIVLAQSDLPHLIWPSTEQAIRYSAVEPGVDYALSQKFVQGEPLTLGRDVPEQLAGALHALARFMPAEDEYMRAFEARFLDRFEGRESVPLMEALDPQFGVWPQFTAPLTDYALAHGWNKLDAPISEQRTHGTHLASPENHIFEAIEVDLEALATSELPEGLVLPPVVSVGFTLLNTDLPNPLDSQVGIFIRGIDCTSGVGLISKPAFEHPELKRAIEDLVGGTQSGRKCIRAEIVHAPTEKSKLIGTRIASSTFELQLFATGNATESNVIRASELHLRRPNGKLILWCPRLDAEIVPIQSSPLAFEAADLQVYKFLCHFQRYGRVLLQVPDGSKYVEWTRLDNCTLPIRLKRIPRLRWRRVIVSDTQWILERTQAWPKAGMNAIEFARTLADAAELPRFISIMSHGPMKDIDLTDSLDCETLKGLWNRTGRVHLQASLSLGRVSPLVFAGKRYANEFILPFKCSQVNQVGQRRGSEVSVRQKKPIFRDDSIIGLHIYLDPEQADSVLREVVDAFLRRGVSDGWTKGWFFIRYSDPFFHLRVRVIRGREQSTRSFLEKLDSLAESLQQGIAWRVELQPYEFESERYGGVDLQGRVIDLFSLHSLAILRLRQELGLLSPVEQIFAGACVTRVVLCQLGLEHQKLLEQATFLRKWALTCNATQEDVLSLASFLYRIHGKEFHLGFTDRESRGGQIAELIEQCFESSQLPSREVSAIWAVQHLQKEWHAMAGRLAHMALNRFFSHDHLIMEACSHDLLTRLLRRQLKCQFNDFGASTKTFNQSPLSKEASHV